MELQDLNRKIKRTPLLEFSQCEDIIIKLNNNNNNKVVMIIELCWMRYYSILVRLVDRVEVNRCLVNFIST